MMSEAERVANGPECTGDAGPPGKQVKLTSKIVGGPEVERPLHPSTPPGTSPSSGAKGIGMDPPSQAQSPDSTAARKAIYDSEHAKTVRWGRALIWGTAVAWLLTVAAAAYSWSGPAEMPASAQGSAQQLSALLMTVALLIATFVVFYLVVNQRELIQRRAHASGAEAVVRFDRREELLAASSPTSGNTSVNG